MYIAIINIDFKEAQLKKINFFILILLVLQLPVVALRFYQLGISELTTGTFAEGGAVTTMFPIAALMYMMAYFAFYKPSIVFPILGFGFVLWSIVGKKRAVLFLYPIVFWGMYYIIYVRGKSIRYSRHIINISLISVIIIVIGLVILKFNPTLNPKRKIGGTIDLEFALNYTKKYNESTLSTNPETPTGRITTFKKTFEKLLEGGFAIFFFGHGPGSFTKSIFGYSVDQRLAIFEEGYGMTPLTYLALEYGVLGLITYSFIPIAFLLMCWKYFKAEVDKYWKAYAAGSLGLSFFMIFLFVGYNYNSITGDSFPILYFYTMGAIFNRLKKIRQKKTAF